ncbi:unnamed protein product [Heterobilharzia americana]|nr:unnamed protein product [Heterobilharzia americana]
MLPHTLDCINIIWIAFIPNYVALILIYNDQFVNTYSLMIPALIQNGGIFISGMKSQDDERNNGRLTTQCHLQYATTENKANGSRIGKIDDDILETSDIKDDQLLNLLRSNNKSTLHYRLREPSNYFALNEATSELTTQIMLDLETLCPRHCRENSFHAVLNAHVEILANFQVVYFVNVEITVTDMNDNSPTFPPSVPRPYRMKLKEVIYRAGKQVELPSAVDKDVQPSNAEIVYRLDSHPEDKSDALETFQLMLQNNTRIVLVLQNDLDYESVKEYRFYLVCSSPYISNEHDSDSSNKEDWLEIIIEVLNINDIEPTFSKAVYEVNVQENVLVNSVIYELKATDKDVDSIIAYSMENGLDSSVTSQFIIESTGKVIVKGRLDHEQRNVYDFTVRASDGEFYALARLVIKVTDVNDELPDKILDPYHLTIAENKPARTLIGHLLIIDRDSPEVNGQVRCEEPPGLKSKQPILFVQESIHLHEILPSSLFPSDFAHSDQPKYSSIQFRSDTNVYQRFTLYSQTEYDRENGADEYQSILLCWDGILNYSPSETLSASFFSSEKSSTLKLSEMPVAMSSGLTATMTIILNVIDENDNAPTFEETLYKAEIRENSPVDTKVIKVNATDKDIGMNAQIYYSLEKNELNTPYFKIDPITGWVMTTAEIDREAQSTFQLTVLAIDGGFHTRDNQSFRSTGSSTTHHTATTQVLISITDENDNAPEFHGPRQFAVAENQPSQTWIGDLQVLDRDEGFNHDVTFKLLPSKLVNSNSQQILNKGPNNFTMNHDLPIQLLNNGSLFTTKPLDRENQSHYCFEVIVTDQGEDKSHSTVDTICVRVLDVNDNRPYFIEIKGGDQTIENMTVNHSLLATDSFNFHSDVVKQNLVQRNISKFSVLVRLSFREIPGYCILVPKALDEDEGVNAQLRYTIAYQHSNITQHDSKKDGILNAFAMNPLTGQLTLTRNLRHDEIGSYEIILGVEDRGKPVLKTEKTVQLIIEDTPPRGNWLFPETVHKRSMILYTSKNIILEGRTIIVVILLSGMSAFLASIFISSILCLIKPCKKSGDSFHPNVKIKAENTNGYYHKSTGFNITMFNDNAVKLKAVPNQIAYKNCYLNFPNQQHQYLIREYSSGENANYVFDNMLPPVAGHSTQQEFEGLLITSECSTLADVEVDNPSLFKLPDVISNKTSIIPNSNSLPTTFDISTYCQGDLTSAKQDPCMMDGISNPCMENVLSQIYSYHNAAQQNRWKYFYLEYPPSNFQPMISNIFVHNMPSKSSTFSVQQPNTNSSSPGVGVTRPSLLSSNISTIKPEQFILQCKKSPPLSVANCYKHRKLYTTSPNPLTCTSIVLHPNKNIFINSEQFNQENAAHDGSSSLKHSEVVTGEEQRSDSGRGASDEENSNQIHSVNGTSALLPVITAPTHEKEASDISVHQTKIN